MSACLYLLSACWTALLAEHFLPVLFHHWNFLQWAAILLHHFELLYKGRKWELQFWRGAVQPNTCKHLMECLIICFRQGFCCSAGHFTDCHNPCWYIQALNVRGSPVLLIFPNPSLTQLPTACHGLWSWHQTTFRDISLALPQLMESPYSESSVWTSLSPDLSLWWVFLISRDWIASWPSSQHHSVHS